MGGAGSSEAVVASTAPNGDFDYKMHLLRQTKVQSYCEETKEDNCSGTYRAIGQEKGVHNEGIALQAKEGYAVDIYTMFEDACEAHKDHNLNGFRKILDDKGTLDMKYTWMSFPDVKKIVDSIACALSKAGVKYEDNVGIFSKNRAEWFQCMIANGCVGARTVALYDTLGDEALEHILTQAEIKILFTEKNKLPKLKEILGKIKHFVQTVVIFDYQEAYGNVADKVVAEEEEKEFDVKDVSITGLSGFMEGAKDVKLEDARCTKVTGDSIANIMYTSGTTGLPKGVQLSHLGVMCAVESAKVKLGTSLEPGGRHYSYLPLAHIFELMVELVCVNKGIGIGYTNGNIKKLAEDLDCIRPTIFIGVPRIYSRFFEKIWATIEAGSGLKKSIAKSAFSSSSVYIRDNKRSGFYDSLVWKGVGKKMGLQNCKLCITGAAPMPGYLQEFMRIATNAPMIQGYGLTETTACGAISEMDDPTVGHNGVPPTCVEIRLVDVPEMNYTHNDTTKVDDKDLKTPRGEIQIKGPAVFKGYYKMPEKTAEVLSEDGWFSTGDIGRINPNGTLSIIDRKKNIFKLSQGEYIAVEKVENQYGKSPAAAQTWVYGNSHKPFVVAVVTPDALWVVKNVLKDKFKCDATPATPEWCAEYTKVAKENLDDIKKATFESMKENTGKLKGFEKIRGIIIEVEVDNLLQGFSVANNCLTPSFKLKRPQLLARYKEQLKKLYTDLGEAPKDGENW